MADLFIKKMVFNREKVPDFSSYPFSIPVIKNFQELSFTSPVTFFIGENGVGKSTFIEALAMCLQLNSESGTQNFLYHSKDTHSFFYDFI